MNLPVTNCKTATIADLKKAFYMRMPISGIEQHVSHYGPHNDELLPMLLIAETPEGIRLFPGIEKAGISYLSSTQLRQSNLLGEEGFFKAMKMGYLLYGIGGGPFDEHGDRVNKQSCINLVVKHLDLFKSAYNRDVYGSLIMYVNYEDQKGDNLIQVLNRENPEHRLTPPETSALRSLNVGGLAQNLKKGFEACTNMEEYKETILGAFQFYKNHIRQAKLFADGKAEFKKIEQNLIPFSIKGEKMNLLRLYSDHPVIHKVVYHNWPSTKKEKLGVLMVHRSNGQFVLIPNRKINPTKMVDVVKIIRQKITFNKRLPFIKFCDLGVEEALDAVPEIHFAASTGVISNGSNVDPDVPGLIGSHLSLKDVVDAVIIGLEETVFPNKFSQGCGNGLCVKGACHFYNFGLQRCHDIRSNISLDSKQVENVS